MQALSTFLAALFTIAVFSFVYGDNPVFRFAEHLFLGLAAAHLTVQGYFNIVDRAWKPLVNKGDLLSLVVIILGLLLMTRYFKQWSWLSRIPMGFMMGVAAALSARRSLDSEFFRQLVATAKMSWNNFNNAFYIAAVLLSMSYFLYCYKSDSKLGNALKLSSRLGQYVMMIAFGASLGSTIMARLSLVIGRLAFLMRDWMHVLK